VNSALPLKNKFPFKWGKTKDMVLEESLVLSALMDKNRHTWEVIPIVYNQMPKIHDNKEAIAYKGRIASLIQRLCHEKKIFCFQSGTYKKNTLVLNREWLPKPMGYMPVPNLD
jgi:hypothetical protein